MKFKIFFVLSILIFRFSLTQAQETICTPDLSQSELLLAQAQAAIDGGDAQGAVSFITDARNILALEVAKCVNYAADAAGDKRTNPVPYGERHAVTLANGSEASIEFIDFDPQPGAEIGIDPPGDGERYILAQYNFYCEASPDDTCRAESLPFKAIGSESVEYVPRSNKLQSGSGDKLYGGGQSTRYLVFLVGEDETDFVIKYAELSSSPTFFATP